MYNNVHAARVIYIYIYDFAFGLTRSCYSEEERSKVFYSFSHPKVSRLNFDTIIIIFIYSTPTATKHIYTSRKWNCISKYGLGLTRCFYNAYNIYILIRYHEKEFDVSKSNRIIKCSRSYVKTKRKSFKNSSLKTPAVICINHKKKSLNSHANAEQLIMFQGHYYSVYFLFTSILIKTIDKTDTNIYRINNVQEKIV